MTDVMRKESRQLSSGALTHINQIKEMGNDFHELISSIFRSPREMALAKTKLEECVMWAVNGISLSDDPTS